MRSTSSFAAAEGQAARSGMSVLGVGVWVVEGRECVGGLDRQLERLVRAFVRDRAGIVSAGDSDGFPAVCGSRRV